MIVTECRNFIDVGWRVWCTNMFIKPGYSCGGRISQRYV